MEIFFLAGSFHDISGTLDTIHRDHGQFLASEVTFYGIVIPRATRSPGFKLEELLECVRIHLMEVQSQSHSLVTHYFHHVMPCHASRL